MILDMIQGLKLKIKGLTGFELSLRSYVSSIKLTILRIVQRLMHYQQRYPVLKGPNII